MEKTLEERIRELEAEVADLRRKLAELEDTVSTLYGEMRSANEALDVVR